MDELYEVSFSGQIQADADLDEVKARIGKMFKADEVMVARLFSGKRIVIKKNLSAEAAEKYSVAFMKAGAICDLDLVPTDASASTPAVDSTAAGAPSSAPGVAADAGANGKHRLKKLATLSAIAVVVVAAVVVAALYVTGILGE